MGLATGRRRTAYADRIALSDPRLTIAQVDHELEELTWEREERPDQRREIDAQIDRCLAKRFELVEVNKLNEMIR